MTPYPLIPPKVYPRVKHREQCFCRLFQASGVT